MHPGSHLGFLLGLTIFCSIAGRINATTGDNASLNTSDSGNNDPYSVTQEVINHGRTRLK